MRDSIRTRRLLLAALAGASLFTVRAASAQNFRSIPQGGRTATMGGAGVATGVDAAMPYLNPAGIAGTPFDVFSVSADVYSYAQGGIKDYFVPSNFGGQFGDLTVKREDFEHKELVTTPSGISYFKHLGDPAAETKHVFAISLTTMSYEESEKTGTFRAEGPTGRLNVDFLEALRYRAFALGPSYAVALGNKVRFGVSALLTYSDYKSDDHTTVTFTKKTPPVTDPQIEYYNDRQLLDIYSIGAKVIAGVQVQPAENFWLGATAELFGLPLKGGGNYVQTSDATVVQPNGMGGLVTNAQRNVAEADVTKYEESRPMRFSLGAAYHKPQSFTIAADGHMMLARPTFRTYEVDFNLLGVRTGAAGGAVTVDQTGKAAGNSKLGTKTTFNVSIGTEVFVTSNASIRAGAFTDLDANEKRREGADVDNARLDFYGATLGLGLKEGDFETTYGLVYRMGMGTVHKKDSFGPDPNAVSSIPYTVHGLMFVLSGVVRTDKEQKKDDSPPLPKSEPAKADAPKTEAPKPGAPATDSKPADTK